MTIGIDLHLRVLALIAAVFCANSLSADTCAPDRVSVRTAGTAVDFNVELAATPEKRARGLMFREEMASDAGMLFVYEYPQRAVFWMKNTLIPLDMIFVDRAGTVRGVHAEAVPGDLTPIDGGRDVFAVLEINGGLAATHGIVPGSALRHPVFSGGPAIWPC